jgi:hypothetical protein
LHFEGIPRHEPAGDPPATGRVVILFEPQADRPQSVPANPQFGYSLLDGAHRFGILTLRIAGACGARLNGERYERDVRGSTHDRFSCGDDDRNQGLRVLSR